MRAPRATSLALIRGTSVLYSYRLYRLDGAGKITAAEWIEAAEDRSALNEARDRVQFGAFELWRKDRLIERVERAGPGV